MLSAQTVSKLFNCASTQAGYSVHGSHGIFAAHSDKRRHQTSLLAAVHVSAEQNALNTQHGEMGKNVKKMLVGI